MIHAQRNPDYCTSIPLWDLNIWTSFFFLFYSVAVNKSGIKAVFYLDVSFRGDEVSQALNGSYQVRAMLLQDLDYRIIRHNITEIINNKGRTFICQAVKGNCLPALYNKRSAD